MSYELPQSVYSAGPGWGKLQLARSFSSAVRLALVSSPRSEAKASRKLKLAPPDPVTTLETFGGYTLR